MKKTWQKMLFLLILVMTISGCGDASIDESIKPNKTNEQATEVPITGIPSQDGQSDSETKTPENSNEYKVLTDIIGKETKVNDFIMPNSKDFILDELEPTYDGVERIQVTYTVMVDYKEVLDFYQDTTNRDEPDYYNAYGYFFDDVNLPEGDNFIEQILVQGLFGKTEVIMIIQNTSHVNYGDTSETTDPEATMLVFDVVDNLPVFEEVPAEVNYDDLQGMTITIDKTVKGVSLWESAKHLGFNSLELTYFIKTPFSEDRIKKVWLREDYFAEEYVMDEFQKKYSYFDPITRLYYEVSELANDEGEEPILFGSMLYTPILEPAVEITHNPLITMGSVEIESCFITELEEKTMLFVIKKDTLNTNEKWIKQWISLDYGVVFREEVYGEDLQLIDFKQLQEVSTQEIPDWMFMPRQDVNYKDQTLGLFFRGNSHSEDLRKAYQSTFSSGFFDLELLDETTDHGYRLTINGDYMSQMAEIENAEDMKGNAIEVIRLRDEEGFKVIVPSKETIYLYPSSIFENQWFQFDDLGFRERIETETEIIYVFDKTDAASVSGMIQRYEYTIDRETNRFISITTYMYDAYIGISDLFNKATYLIQELTPSDDSVFEIPGYYNTVYIFSHDDGENPPPWWE